MRPEAVNDLPIIRVRGDEAVERLDPVATEFSYVMEVNGRELLSLRCSPTDVEALAAGFLLAEGLVTAREDIESIAVDSAAFRIQARLPHLAAGWHERLGARTLTSGCGYGITFTDGGRLDIFVPATEKIPLGSGRVRGLLKDFVSRSRLFLATGGTHSAALVDRSGLVIFAEDIGRHNAVDKVIGRALLDGIGVAGKVLLSSGRISGEIMTKVIRARIPVLISRAAPTCMAVHHAEFHGVTLIGFARSGRMNIYTHPQRIDLS